MANREVRNTATLPAKHTENARNLEPQKERTDSRKLLAFADGEFRELVDARWYMARRSDGASPIYCSVWVTDQRGNRYFAGHGKAGGYGYCKLSGAFDEAVTSAGIKLAKNVHGTGMSTVHDAMLAIAVALGYSLDQVTVTQ